MFEIIKSDLAGRIGILHSNHGKIETPAYVPVIHPVKQLIPTKKIKDIGLKNFLQKILSGELDIISGNYLFLFITSFLIIFILAMINIYLQKRSNIIK